MTDPAAASAPRRAWPWLVVLASAALGLGLIVDAAGRSSATYDEVTYLKVGARWWRTGEQATISRMGTPLTFWKLQQTPTLFLIDRFGDPAWIDDPIAHQARLLPRVRIGGAWAWLAAFALTAGWARAWYGGRAMALAAAVFALSPNLLAHGTLATMELPLVAAATAMVLAFARFLRSGRRRWFWASAALGGLAFSCKFTTVIIPPILGLIWAGDRWSRRDAARPLAVAAWGVAWRVGLGMVAYAAALAGADVVLTGGEMIRLSPRSGPHPSLGHFGPMIAGLVAPILERRFPQDWVGFATQMIFQRNGGPSYLLGQRRCSGWWAYYPTCLAVKVPLACWFLVLVRARWRPSPGLAARREWFLLAYLGLFLLAAVVGSKRNYGVRYLLPLAPAAIVWTSALANAPAGRRWVPWAGVAGMALAVASVHPHELSYFNRAAGGPEGGRRVLSDSNLDWGQGARAVARLQADRPEFRDLTWYAFGDTDPAHYGVTGSIYLIDAHRPPANLPPTLMAATSHLAVSASLQWGPWGPPGYFAELDRLEPVAFSDDWTVAFYRTADLVAARADPVRTGPGPD